MLDRDGRIPAAVPNWQSAVETRYEFKTFIHTSRDGSERREALRVEPRLAVQFETILSQSKRLRHVRDLVEGADQQFVVPWRWHKTTTAALMISGAASFTVDSVPHWLVEGAVIVLVTETTEIARTVESVVGVTITVTAPVGEDVAAGSKVCRAYTMWAENSVTAAMQTRDGWTGSMTFEQDPGAEPVTWNTLSPTQFESVDLFETKPNWREAPDLLISQIQDTFDPGQGRRMVESVAANQQMTLKLLFTGRTYAQAEALIDFFCRHKGRQGEFWMPTWIDDVPANDQSSGTNSLTVPGEDFDAVYNGSDVWNVVAARQPDGSIQLNRITSMTTSGGDSVLTMEDNWTADITASTKLGFCPRWRFAADLLRVEWRTSTVAEITMAMQTLPNEPEA